MSIIRFLWRWKFRFAAGGAVCLCLFLCYILRSAALPLPQNADGENVLPIFVDPTDDQPIDAEKRVTRRPIANAKSLIVPDDNARFVENWDAVLTLAQLSSEVYGDNRVSFAKDVLGFKQAAVVDRGGRHSLVCSTPEVIVIVFRGTHVLTDFLLDGSAVPFAIGSPNDGCMIHSGFHLACDVLYDDVLREIDRQNGRSKRLIVTGHSLGGAMAVAFAYRSSLKGDLDPQSIVTFGQPLVANGRFAAKLVGLFEGRHRRFVHRNDLVSRVARPYFHSGSRVLLVKNQAPQFWKPEVLIQAGPIGSDEPDEKEFQYSTDPDIQPVDEESLEQIKEYAKDNDASQGKPVTSQRRQKVASTRASALGWIMRGLDDHRMEYYIDCIKDQAVEISRGE
jgi:hypothetical protein